MKDFFKQTPIAPTNLKPILPDDVNLNDLTDQILKDKAILDAQRAEEAKKFGEQLLADRIAAQRAEDAENRRKQQEADDKKKWHDDVARRNREAEAAKTAAAADKAKRLHVARQIELKAKLSTLLVSLADAGLIVEELEDKNCLQVKLLVEAATQLVHSIKFSEALRGNES